MDAYHAVFRILHKKDVWYLPVDQLATNFAMVMAGAGAGSDLNFIPHCYLLKKECPR